MFTYSFLVVFEAGDRPCNRVGNGAFKFGTNDPEMKSPTIDTIREWEQEIREQLGDGVVVITSLFPLAS